MVCICCCVHMPWCACAMVCMCHVVCVWHWRTSFWSDSLFHRGFWGTNSGCLICRTSTFPITIPWPKWLVQNDQSSIKQSLNFSVLSLKVWEYMWESGLCWECCTCLCVCICVNVHMSVCICVFLCVYVCVSVCICVWLYMSVNVCLYMSENYENSKQSRMKPNHVHRWFCSHILNNIYVI